MPTGRCYCGAVTLHAATMPERITYCHCTDCRRLTGAPVAAFVAISSDDVTVTPDPGAKSTNPGVVRRFCGDCGSALTAEFDYLPGQVYVPIGILDQAADMAPQIHAHYDARLPWLHLDDALPRQGGTARAQLGSGM